MHCSWRGEDEDWRGSSYRKKEGSLEEEGVVYCELSDDYVAFITCSYLSEREKEDDVDSWQNVVFMEL